MFFLIGAVAIIIISLMIGYVYVHRPRYGIYLIIVVSVLVAVFSSWALLEPKIEDNKSSKISISDVSIKNQSLKPAYGNRYLYQAEFKNLSASNQLNFVILALQLQCENLNKDCSINSSSKVKLWLKPGLSKIASAYFDVQSHATEIKERQWHVSVVSTRAK